MRKRIKNNENIIAVPLKLAPMAVLMYFVFRLLVFRREGAVRVRYLTIVNITAHSGLITVDFMNSPNGIEQTQTTPTHVRKILKDGRLLILHGEQWYDIT